METLVTSRIQSWLVWFLRGILILGFIILLARLVDLQVIRGKYFRLLAEGNRIHRVTISAARGRILARGGEVIAGNREVQRRVIFNPETGFEKSDLLEGAEKQELITESVRDYDLGYAAAHLTGYLGEVTAEELGKIRAECPEFGPRGLGFWLGRGGLEEEYDCLLSGLDGEELVEVDAVGNRVRILGRKNPIAGKDLKTTIDLGLQEKVAELMKNKPGAVVITDAEGEVMALFSSPSFDPNIFIESRTSEVTGLLNNQSKPLFNRAIGGKFHPGSVFKPVVAIAALEEGVIEANYKYEDTGKISIETRYGNFTYTNWYFNQYGGVEGVIGLPRAMARSTDTFFYKLGELLGADKLSGWAVNFGLNKRTGIDIPGEIAGLVPNPGWKLETKGEPWFLGNTYHMAIGQGDIALTPVAINTAIAIIANDGKLCTPHIYNKEGALKQIQCRNLEIDKRNIDLVKRGMREACNPGGTGFTFFDFKEKNEIDVGCKTGTAETEKGEPHAWFTVFAPAEKPEVVATVLIENGGEGSRVAGPIAREIFDYWFSRSINY